jgi:hypothetical protein
MAGAQCIPTSDGQWLEASGDVGSYKGGNVRYVRVTTTAGPSWVAWKEIEVYSAVEYFEIPAARGSSISPLDAAFANPDIYEFLEAEGMGYAIRLPANRVLPKAAEPWSLTSLREKLIKIGASPRAARSRATFLLQSMGHVGTGGLQLVVPVLPIRQLLCGTNVFDGGIEPYIENFALEAGPRYGHAPCEISGDTTPLFRRRLFRIFAARYAMVWRLTQTPWTGLRLLRANCSLDWVQVKASESSQFWSRKSTSVRQRSWKPSTAGQKSKSSASVCGIQTDILGRELRYQATPPRPARS